MAQRTIRFYLNPLSIKPLQNSPQSYLGHWKSFFNSEIFHVTRHCSHQVLARKHTGTMEEVSSSSKRRRGLGLVTANACSECRKKRAKVRRRPLIIFHTNAVKTSISAMAKNRLVHAVRHQTFPANTKPMYDKVKTRCEAKYSN